MLVLVGIVLGAVIGVFRARSKGGNGADMAQYGFVLALFFGLIGLIATIVLARLG